MKKILLYSLLTIIILVVTLISYVKLALPNVGEAEDLKIAYTPERVAHGKYLAHAVAACMDCHSTRDWSKFAGPLTEGTLGKGGEVFPEEFGFPGTFYSKNITPYSIGDWTDGELLRAITSGVNKNGEALFPVMPHAAYGKADREDIYDIIAYLRSLPAIKNDVPTSEASFPMNIIINTFPTKAEFSKKPNKSDKLAYGKYLFTMASCTECHTKQDKGTPIEGMEMAGGFEFPLPNGTVRSANLTPDKETGIGNWNEEFFVKRFKMYTDSGYVDPIVTPISFQTVMPWKMYAQMEEGDLQAIFAYLQSIKPIKNKVEKFTAATAK